MKISADKKFALLERCNKKTHEAWYEILNLTKISSITEHRYGKGVYNGEPGRRHGYDVFTEGGHQYGQWISDVEFKYLLDNGFFGGGFCDTGV